MASLDFANAALPEASKKNNNVGGAGADNVSEASAPVVVDEPLSLTCPITHLVFRDPVVLIPSGNTYERSAVKALISSAKASSRPLRDPRTNVTLPPDFSLVPNRDKRREVVAFLDAHPNYTPTGWTTRSLPPVEEDAPTTSTSRSNPILNNVQRMWLRWWPAENARTAITVACVAVACAVGWCGRDWVAVEHANAAARTPSFFQESENTLLKAHFPSQCAIVDTVASGAFAFFWLAFVFLWTCQAHAARAPLPFMLFSLPFWFVGVMMLRESTSLFTGTCLSSDLSIMKDAMQPQGVAYELRRTFRAIGTPWPMPVRRGAFGDVSVVEQATLGSDTANPMPDDLPQNTASRIYTNLKSKTSRDDGDDGDGVNTARAPARRWCLNLKDEVSNRRVVFACTGNHTRLVDASTRINRAADVGKSRNRM
ncbi:U-box domain-containing protein [Pseudoscourfieldia marina]